MNRLYRLALDNCLKELDQVGGARGMERVIQRSILNELPVARQEVPLHDVGAIRFDGEDTGRMDIVVGRNPGQHGVEIKVVRLPRLRAVPANALYDVGQLTADYWRISNATELRSGELLILLYGPMVLDLKSGAAICRELHNRLYVDFQTSLQFAELREQGGLDGRVRQMAVAEVMGIDRPCERSTWTSYVKGNYALVSVPVVRGVMPPV